MAEPEALSRARRLGELEGEAFDRELAAAESRERQERLAALVLGGESALLEPAAESRASRPGALEEARRRVEELAEFQRAIYASRGWRLIQAVRRLAGRAW